MVTRYGNTSVSLTFDLRVENHNFPIRFQGFTYIALLELIPCIQPSYSAPAHVWCSVPSTTLYGDRGPCFAFVSQEIRCKIYYGISKAALKPGERMGVYHGMIGEVTFVYVLFITANFVLAPSVNWAANCNDYISM